MSYACQEKEVRNRQCLFLDQEIKKLMDEREQVHKVACESGAAMDWELYRWCRNEVKRGLCDAERNYVQKDVTELANEFFTSVGASAAAESKRRASVNALPAYNAPSAKTIFQPEEFRFRAVTTFEVRKIIVSFFQTEHQELISYT